jgi:polyisoprenoid-binding protein YceI
MSTAVETGSWKLDPARSTVALSQKNFWGLATVRGAITSVSGAGDVREDGTATGSVTLDATSISTGNPKRDEHLRSADFFECSEHPTFVFTVSKAATKEAGEPGKPGEAAAARIEGELTIRGVSKPHTIDAEVSRGDDGSVALNAEFQVERTDFGLTWNQLGMMRGPATVSAALCFTRAESAA